MLAHLYDRYGRDAVYTPAAGGGPVDLRVRPSRPRDDVDLGAVGVEAERRRLRVRVSEIGSASPRGGTVVLDGETLRIKRAALDDHRSEYRLGLEQVTG